MPSTGWNVFVGSLVALVVYTAVQAEMVLLGIAAGILTFVTGWLLGYAINEDLLDSMELSRIAVAGAVTVFAIVYTLLYTQQQYILGLVVVCLVWFAAWFTSSMGPIKGDTGAMETIDEPRPPAGTEPGEALHLGSPEEQYTADDGGSLGGLLGFGSAAGDTAYSTDPAGSDDTAAQTADSTTQTATTRSGTKTSEESIFGLGIFYETAPTSNAGADGHAPTRIDTHRTPEPTQQAPQSPQSPQSDDRPGDSPTRATEHPSAGHTLEASDSSHDATPTGSDADQAEQPPDEHRVDVADDDSGFVFG